MKVTVVTIRVPGNPIYDECTARWLDTYIQFKPQLPHELVVVDSDNPAPGGRHGKYANRFMVYTGGGWDCGIWQYVGQWIETDLLVCCNTSTHFVRHGWLDRIVEEVERHGVGLYGPMTSRAHFDHIRTPCMIFQPRIIRRYPFLCDSRPKTYAFECLAGQNNFTLWCQRNGFPPRMITWDGCYDMPDWRSPENVFWKGDQSNLLLKDRHADRYDAGNEQEKQKLNREADGR